MCFRKTERKFLNDKHHGVTIFYVLPKIRKSMLVESAINTQNSEIIETFEPNDLKLRPIVGSPKCPTRKLSQLIGRLLKPFLKCIKSFIHDSLDFLNKCPRDVDENSEIVTFDVISWYRRIPHNFVLEAIGYFLTKYQGDLHPRFRKEFVLESASFILKNNTFTLDSECYLQIKGTVMGTTFASTYANLTMGYHKIKVYYYQPELRFSQQTFSKFLVQEFQLLLKVNLIKSEHLLSILNQINNNFHFTMEKSQIRLPFLRYYDKQKWNKKWTDS